jgi:dTDP-4-amino-4,6-dideoxygalactose transaminase
VGSFSDAAVYSFNRGKNLPLLNGGAVAVNRGALTSFVSDAISDLHPVTLRRELLSVCKLAAVCFASRPWVYGCCYRLLSRFRDLEFHEDFETGQFGRFQAALGLRLLKKRESSFEIRRQNGLALCRALRPCPELIHPNIDSEVVCVFNRYPVVFREPEHRRIAQERLLVAGIDSSRFYERPLHQIYPDLGYGPEEFSNAVYFAQRLLTLPVHPNVRKEDIEKMAEIIRESVR